MPAQPHPAPVTTSRTLGFAFPLAGGRWLLRRGTADLIDGYLHSIELPGLGTRAGPPGEGLSAIFHVVHRLSGSPEVRRGDVVRWWVENGRVVRTEAIAEDVELIE